MKRLLTLLALVLATTTVKASTIEFYTTSEGLPYSYDQIFNFQLESSMKQYSEEQQVKMKPYTEQRIEQQQFALLDKKGVVLALATSEDDKLCGVSWMKPTEDGANMLMRQTNATSMDIYKAIAARTFENFGNLQSISFKLPDERLAIFAEFVKQMGAIQTEAFEDDDSQFAQGLNFTYWKIMRPEEKQTPETAEQEAKGKIPSTDDESGPYSWDSE